MWYKTDWKALTSRDLPRPSIFTNSVCHSFIALKIFNFFALLYVSVNTNKEKFFVLHFMLLLLTPRLGYKVGIHIIS